MVWFGLSVWSWLLVGTVRSSLVWTVTGYGTGSVQTYGPGVGLSDDVPGPDPAPGLVRVWTGYRDGSGLTWSGLVPDPPGLTSGPRPRAFTTVIQLRLQFQSDGLSCTCTDSTVYVCQFSQLQSYST